MTLVAACYYKSFGLTMVFLVVQSCALAWYCLSYIPGGRAAVSSILGGCFGSGTSSDAAEGAEGLVR